VCVPSTAISDGRPEPECAGAGSSSIGRLAVISRTRRYEVWLYSKRPRGSRSHPQDQDDQPRPMLRRKAVLGAHLSCALKDILNWFGIGLADVRRG
jgi:hypothetical protein